VESHNTLGGYGEGVVLVVWSQQP